MGISIGGHYGARLGDVRDVSIHGFPGCGIFGLYINLKVSAGNLKSEAFISQLECRIELDKPTVKIGNGFLENQPTRRWTEYSDVEQMGFLFYLSGSQIEAIETYRCSGDIKLAVWLAGNALYEGQSQTFSDRGEFVIPKQQWLEALNGMGYRDTLLFELPMPKSGGDEVSKLKEFLERAQNHILNGHFQESVGLCRKAIEWVEKERGDKNEAGKSVDKFKESRRDMTINDRMLFLREGLKNITHLGAHENEEFSRLQAQAILGMTVALLSSPEIGVQK